MKRFIYSVVTITMLTAFPYQAKAWCDYGDLTCKRQERQEQQERIRDWGREQREEIEKNQPPKQQVCETVCTPTGLGGQRCRTVCR